MEEYTVNLHVHSNYSDGSLGHQAIAEAGIEAGLDAIITTDHNVLVKDLENYYRKDGKKILVLVGEEIHDKSREPQKSHLVTFGQSHELCNYANNIQLLLNHLKKNGALSFIAHPFEEALPLVNETDITWEDWDVEGFTGIEIWNHLSELKNTSKNWISLLFHVFFPNSYAKGPHHQTMKKWDEILLSGKRIVAVGGSDAHCLKMRKWFLERHIFPYQFHFNSINNHLFLPQPLSGNFLNDRKLIYDAFSKGNLFVGYDLPDSTKGFRFYAQGKSSNAIMGDEIDLDPSITFQIKIPDEAECRLIHNGKVIKTWVNQDICSFITKSPGIYRVECYIQYLGIKRGWIFSNPIYVNNKGNENGSK